MTGYKKNIQRIDHRKIKGCQENIRARKRNEHGSVDGRVASKSRHVWLECTTGVGTGDRQWRVCQVQLRDPCHVSWSVGCVTRDSNVGVVGANRLARRVPLEEDLAANEGQGDAAVLGDRRAAVLANNG